MMGAGGYMAGRNTGILRLRLRMTSKGGTTSKVGCLRCCLTVGGQTALNLAVDLADSGVLEKYGVELIGAKLEAIKKAEDRLLFKDAMPRSGWICRSRSWCGT